VVDGEPSGGTWWRRRSSLKYGARVPPFALQPEQRGNGRHAKHSAAAARGATRLRSSRRPSSSRWGRRGGECHRRTATRWRARGGTTAYVATGRSGGVGVRVGGPSIKARCRRRGAPPARRCGATAARRRAFVNGRCRGLTSRRVPPAQTRRR